MVSIQVNKSGYHSVNVNNSGKSIYFKKKKFEKKEGYSDIDECVNSTKRIVKKIIHNQPFEKTSFLTLTFQDEKFSDYSLAVYEFTKFIQRLNYFIYNTKIKKIKYLGVPELQKRGVWHFHIVLFDVPYIPQEKLQDIWGLGFIKINKVNDINHLSNYVLKYITKSLYENIQKYKKKILTSKGLDKGFHISGGIDDMDVQIAMRYLYSESDLQLVCSLKKDFGEGKGYVLENLYEVYFSKNFYSDFQELFSIDKYKKKMYADFIDDIYMSSKKVPDFLDVAIKKQEGEKNEN